MPAVELPPLPDGYRAALARCRFVTLNLDHTRLWAYTDNEETAKVLGNATRYRSCSNPETYEYEITSTHPDALALAVEVWEGNHG